MHNEPIVSDDDRGKLDGLMRFAHGVLTARDKVQMTLSSSGLGAYHEGAVAMLPGVHLDEEDAAWLRVDRLREAKPPAPADYVVEFMSSKGADPERRPELMPTIARDVVIEDASDLAEAELLRPENVHAIEERGIEISNRVRVTLHAEDCREMLRAFEIWRDGTWADWAATERPIRKSITLYQSLFKLHSAIHAAEGVPPELVWGIGVGRWKTGADEIDMPLLEQLVDIEIEDGGAITVRSRDLPPSLSLKPYLQIEVLGAAKLQNQLKDALAAVLMAEEEFSPFNPSGWEHILATASAQLSESSTHTKRADLEAGAGLQPIREQLAVASSWVIYGRARSAEARTQDIEALRRALADPGSPIPLSIKGFAAPEPDNPRETTDTFGLNSGLLATGGAANVWTLPTGSSATAGAAGNVVPSDTDQTHFFPLPFNRDQSKIIDFLDDPKNRVVTVTGPPGTGKTHTIANIISHCMATGKRVLVTARTPEAIAAVREKLPESLRSLVIASVGTDRESAQQLRDAVSELSDEVIGLNVNDVGARRRALEQQIVVCDDDARTADQKLAAIARENLTELTWNGKTRSVMAVLSDLEAHAEQYDWFTDSPGTEPPGQLAETLQRLQLSLPRMAPDIAYAGESLPAPADLPSGADLVAAHKGELAWNRREIPDYAGAPPMVRNTADTDREAQALLEELEDSARIIAELTDFQTPMLLQFAGRKPPGEAGETVLRQLSSFISGFRNLSDATEIRFDLGSVAIADFLAAAERGAAGRKPISITGGAFNSALKKAVASVTLDGQAPATPEEWRVVYAAGKLHAERANIEAVLFPLRSQGLLPALPSAAWEVAVYLEETNAAIRATLSLAPRLAVAQGKLEELFPTGLRLDTFWIVDAIQALRANLPETYQAPVELAVLDELAGESDLPLFRDLRVLRSRLGTDEIDPEVIVRIRNDLTREIGRLAALEADLSQTSRDLEELATAGAPDWVARLRADPIDATALIPEDWTVAWAWAVMKARTDRIVALGNGDEHRKAKAVALRRRGKLMEELIRVRTLLGLNQRMSSSVKRALHAFTEAIARIGKGMGKNAPRFRLAAQEAAKEASSAAPVWIMPEYKIPEQLPPKIGDFDLVILDEASQSDITAVAALLRGKSILIVGDEEQVSPSNVGIPVQRINALRADCLMGLPNANLLDEKTSIFEIARRMHPDTHVVLTEHFRCVTPIIQFSTRFYANRLVPLRVPKASERFDPPLVDVYVKGTERRGDVNKDEARYIVCEIARIVADPAHENRDIGVISLLGRNQADAVERELITHPEIGTEKIIKHRIICGDARAMQGQERSIVFLSMVATPGAVRSQNSKDVQQRINVAMSRARDRLYLVHSVSLEDLKPEDIKSKVIQHFQDPMPEGRNPIGSGTSDDLFAMCDSGFERKVLQLLLEANYRARPQVKVGGYRIDLVVEGTEDRRLAIELDGDANHGPDVWERDMARQAQLERAGWVFWRVFGSQWIAQKEHWWQDLKNTLIRMDIEPIGFQQLDERFTEFRTHDPSQPDFPMPASAGEVAPTPSKSDELVPTNLVEADGQRAKADGGALAPSAGENLIISGDSAGTMPMGAPRWADYAGKPSETTAWTDVQDVSAGGAKNTPNPLGEENTGAAVDDIELDSSAEPEVEMLSPTVSPSINSDKTTLEPAGFRHSEAKIDPGRFYDPSYRPQIQALAADFIDSEGPITFKRLGDRIARAHGFQRTGRQIKSAVWAACQKLRRYEETPDGHKVFWPGGAVPRGEVSFRGLTVNGERRKWGEVPHPEKISLVREVIGTSGEEGLARAVAERVGIGRVTTQFRAEIGGLAKQLEHRPHLSSGETPVKDDVWPES